MSAIRNGSHPRHGLSSSRVVSGVGSCNSDPLASATECYRPLQSIKMSRLPLYLYHQIRSREYDRLANLAVLNFQSHLYNPDVVVNILVKALASVRSLTSTSLSPCWVTERRIPTWMIGPSDLLPNLTNLQSLAAINLGFPHFGRMYQSDALETLYDNYSGGRWA
ncbi:hypothetical protein BJV77DRAFT_28223 [Russula vinacea]|nr:hypothetical protein BJV77DRAFT_28223 [Russula vinacea]